MKPLERVLYVEDEADMQAIAQLALEKIGGLGLCICSSGQEALGLVDDYDPDLVVLDVMMPEMDGPATLAALRERPETAGKPIVFMTGKDRPAEIERLLDLGAIGVVTKPIDPMRLADQMREFWARSQS